MEDLIKSSFLYCLSLFTQHNSNFSLRQSYFFSRNESELGRVDCTSFQHWSTVCHLGMITEWRRNCLHPKKSIENFITTGTTSQHQKEEFVSFSLPPDKSIYQNILKYNIESDIQCFFWDPSESFDKGFYQNIQKYGIWSDI